MRLLPVIAILTFFLTLTFDSSNCQLRFGSNGMRLLPPINLTTIFRILKKSWESLTSGPQQASSKAKEGRGATKAENRVGAFGDIRSREEIIAGLTEEEKLILNELKIKVKISCYTHNLDCNNITLENYIKSTNGNLTEEERNATLKLVNTSSLDFQVSELVDAKIENKITVTDDSSLDKAPKTPSFLPYPFASGGWLMSYVVVNSVLMGLYIFLSWPYFLTGRVVDRLVKSDDAETTTSRGAMSAEEMDQMEKYMGYTSYGDTDMFMSYMMSAEDDDKAAKNNGEMSSENTNNEKDNMANDSGENTKDVTGGNDDTEESITTEKGDNYNDKKSKNSKDEDNTSKETEEDNKIKDDKDDHTKCIESILCLRPVYGARALSSASLALKLLEWLPGLDSIGSIGKRFKRNVNRFGKAIDKGRINDCHDYLCPKDNKEKPTR